MSSEEPAGFGTAPLGEEGGLLGASHGPDAQAPGVQAPGVQAPDGQAPPPVVPPTPPLDAEVPPPLEVDARSSFRRNWYALASLATVVILAPGAMFASGSPMIVMGTAVVGVTFAQFALATAKGEGRPLRKTSIWAMGLNVVMIPGWLVVYFALSSHFGLGDTNDVSLGQLVTGDCIQRPTWVSDAGGDVTSDVVARVACTDEHWGQVYFMTTLERGGFPGNTEIVGMANDACYSDEAVKAIVSSKLDSAMPLVLYPTQASWELDDRDVMCLLSEVDEKPIIGSWLVAG